MRVRIGVGVDVGVGMWVLPTLLSLASLRGVGVGVDVCGFQY